MPDRTRSWVESLAVTDFILWGGVVNKVIRWGACKILGYSTRTTEIIVSQARLRQKYPLEKELAMGDALHACWLSGEGVLPEHEDLFKSGVIKKLLLPDPASPYLSVLRESFGDKKPAYDFPAQIRNMTALAKNYRIPIRWLKGMAGMSVTVCEPQNGKAWAHLDILFPSIDPTKRHIIRLDGTRDNDIIGQYRNAIDQLFGNDQLSHEPNQ